MHQTAFRLNPAIRPFESHFATAIMAEKRQEFSQTTLFPFESSLIL